jgi:DNA-binding transcriptional regulator YiaG
VKAARVLSARLALVFLALVCSVAHAFSMREFRLTAAQGARIRAELRRGFAARRAAREALPPPITLKELRRELHLTQDDLALRLGINQSRVSKLERRADPTVGTLRAHVEALGGSLDLVARFPGRSFQLLLP